MPLKLVPPRPGRTPHYHIRGTYLGHYVDRSAKTERRAVAYRVLKDIERQIERGAFAAPGPSFAAAALAYMRHGGERRPLRKLLRYFGELPLAEIDQAAIEAAAEALFPDAAPATRNREVFTPVSAVLKHAGIDFRLRRPKGSRGQQIDAWLWPEDAARLFSAAAKLDREFGVLLVLLCYTGLRLSEALSLRCDDVRVGENYARVMQRKTGVPRGVYLPPCAVEALAEHPRGIDRGGERLFRFAKSGHLYKLLRAAAGAAGIEFPARAAFHLFRHTFATWMRRYAGRDVQGLVATGAWRSEQSAARYAHVVPSEDARAAALLPSCKIRAGAKN